MRILGGAALFAALAVFAGAAAAADETVGPFSCVFDKGENWTFEAGKFSSAPPMPLNFDIDQIDLDGQTVRLLIAGKPGGALRVIRALNANHYLEVANEGFLNLTTVYDLDAASGVYPAVHSRHFGLFGQPVFAQYAGTCKLKPAQ